MNKTVEKLQQTCPFPIDGSTQIAITGVVNPRPDSFGIVCTVSSYSGATHEVVVRVSEIYYLAAKNMLEFVRAATGLNRASLPFLH